MDAKSWVSFATQRSQKSVNRESDGGKIIEPEIEIVEIMRSFRLFEYKGSTIKGREEREEFFQSIDVESLLENIKQAEAEKNRLASENYLLRTFLTKNDKILLLGQTALFMTRDSVMKSLRMRVFEDADEQDGANGRHSVASHRSVMSHVSRHSVASKRSRGTTQSRSDKTDRKLNYMTKAALAHRERIALEKRISHFEKEAKDRLETIRAKIVELDMRRKEVYLTEDNFLMNFSRTPENYKFLEIATEQQLYSRFSKFISGIFKNAKTFKCSMHLTVDTLQSQSRQLYNSIIIHTDLHKTLTEPDNEVLEIRLHEMMDEYKMKHQCSSEYQQITFIKSTELSKETRKYESEEVELTQIVKQKKHLKTSTDRLKKELKFFIKSNEVTMLKITNLRKQLQMVHAPSVADYMRVKTAYERLLKDKKVLMRQTNLIKLKKILK